VREDARDSAARQDSEEEAHAAKAEHVLMPNRQAFFALQEIIYIGGLPIKNERNGVQGGAWN